MNYVMSASPNNQSLTRTKEDKSWRAFLYVGMLLKNLEEILRRPFTI